jgi:pimeloyl-ACP methyl ester carboxylesterase
MVNGISSTKYSRRNFLRHAVALAGGGLLSSRLPAQEPLSFNFIERNCRLRLPNGRRLAFLELGDADASWIIFHHHGNPSSRAEGERFRPALQCTPGVRVITPERPGFGDSDPDPDADYLSWPADLAFLADTLCIRSFATSGYSNGTAYALAVARAMPERVHVVVGVSSIAPFDSMDGKKNLTTHEAAMAEHHPGLASFLIKRSAAPALRHPDRLPFYYAFMREEKKEIKRDSIPRIQGAFQQGPREVVRSAALMREPWAWWLGEVPTKVKLLHGCKDKNAPPRMATFLANALPNAELRWYPDEDHLSLFRNHAADVLAAAMPPV